MVDNFDSGSGGTTEFVTEKAGVLAYVTLFDTKFLAMQTGKNVHAFRVERSVFELMNTPIIVGGTYINDTDGIDEDYTGNVLQEKINQGTK